MFERNFPELIDSFEGMDDAASIQAFIDAATAAGLERIDAEAATPGTLSNEAVDEMDRFNAAIAAAEVRLAEIKADAEKRQAKLAGLGFKRPSAPPPAPAPAAELGTPEPECDDCGKQFTVTPQIVTTGAVGRFAEGAVITSLAEQGEALAERAKRIGKSNTGEKFTVMQIRDYIPESLVMPTDGRMAFGFLNDDRYDEDGLVAGFCAPPTVDYGFCGGSSPERPYLAALRRYQAPRGRVTKVKTPLFSAVGTDPDEVDDTGIGFWTNEDDDANPFVNKTCSIMTCPTDEDFELYSTYNCVTIKNFMQIAYPEWVAFYSQQLDALWARQAEVQLLDQTILRAGAAITTTATYGALASFLSRLNLAMNNYTENERYNSAGLMATMPRWVVTMLQNDAIRRGQTLTVGQIRSGLADIGISRVVFTMDNPTAYGAYPTQAKGAALEDLPDTVWVLLHRADGIRALDFGTTDLGITTEKAYRDTASNLRNDFQMFVESFEGIIDMGCPVWRVEIPLCDNGLIAPTSGYAAEPCGTPSALTGF